MEKNKIIDIKVFGVYTVNAKLGDFVKSFWPSLENMKFKENVLLQNSKISITSQFSKALDPHRVGPASMLWRQDTMNDDSMQMDFIK